MKKILLAYGNAKDVDEDRKSEKVIKGLKTELEQLKKMQYPSAKLLLNEVKEECQYEEKRRTGLFTRTGVIIPFLTALLFYGAINMKIFRIDKLMEFKFEDPLSHVLFWVAILSYLVLSGGFIASLIYAFSVLFVKDYSRNELEIFNKTKAKVPDDVMAMAFVLSYKEIVEHLAKNNDNISGTYKKLIISVIVIIIMMVLCTIINALL